MEWVILLRLGDHDRIEADAEAGEWRVVNRG